MLLSCSDLNERRSSPCNCLPSKQQWWYWCCCKADFTNVCKAHGAPQMDDSSEGLQYLGAQMQINITIDRDGRFSHPPSKSALRHSQKTKVNQHFQRLPFNALSKFVRCAFSLSAALVQPQIDLMQKLLGEILWPVLWVDDHHPSVKIYPSLLLSLQEVAVQFYILRGC